MYKRLRNLFYLAFIAILIAAFLRVRAVAQLNPAGNAVVQETATIDRGDVVLTVSASGPVKSKQEVPVSFPIQGVVRKITVSEGQRVLKGQTLAMLDTDLLESAVLNAQAGVILQEIILRNLADTKPRDVDVAVAKASLNAARAQLGAASITPDDIQIRLQELQLELTKNQTWQIQLQRDQAIKTRNDIVAATPAPPMRPGAPPGNIPESQVAGAKDQAASANQNARAAEYNILVAQQQLNQIKNQKPDAGQVASAAASIQQAQANLDKLMQGASPETISIARTQLEAARTALDLAKYNLTRATLTAPFDGMVAKMNLTLGEAPPMTQPAVLLLDDSSYYVDIPVDEADVAKLALDQRVTLAVDALPNTLIRGKVTQIAQTSTKVGDVVTYSVRAEIDPADQAVLRSGMSSTATVTVSELKDVVRVRNRFIRLDRRTDKAYVTVRQANGSVKEVEVQLGQRNETYSEVKSGLNVGDTVVVLPRTLQVSPGVQ